MEYSPKLAEQLAHELEPLSAEELLSWAADEFGDRLCLTCSWQKQSSALVHMLSELDLQADVIEFDAGQPGVRLTFFPGARRRGPSKGSRLRNPCSKGFAGRPSAGRAAPL